MRAPRLRTLVAVPLAAALVGFGAWLGSEDAQPASGRSGQPAATGTGTGKVRVRYRRASGADVVAARVVRSSRLAEETARALRSSIRLPRDVTIVFGGDPDGPFYDPETRSIQYPWQFVTQSRRLLAAHGYAAADLAPAVVDATRFILHHEVGHALVDLLELPVLGREEDAADGFAAFTAVEIEEDPELVIAATDLFAAFDAEAGDTLDDAAFFDSHSLDLQRFGAISCLAYGSDPDALANVVSGTGMDRERLGACPEEWGQVRDGWNAVLEPWLAG